MSEDTTLDTFVDRSDSDSSRPEAVADNWPADKVESHSELISGAHVKSDNVHTDSTATPYLTGPEDFEGLGFTVTKYTDEPTKFCEPGDTLVTVKGSGCGKAAFSSERACISRQLKSLRPNSSINPLYLYYSIKSKRRFLETLSEGSAIPGLSNTHLTTLDIPVPLIEEQRKIASVLYTVDQAIQKTKETNEQARRTKKGVAQYLFSNGFCSHSEYRDTIMGKLPKDWDAVNLGSIVQLRNGLNFSTDQKGKGTLIVNVPDIYGPNWIEPNGLDRVDISKKQVEKYQLKEGDIVTVRSSKQEEGAGQVAIFRGHNEPVVFAGFTIRQRPNMSVVSPAYLIQYLRDPKTRKKVVSLGRRVALTNLSQGDLEKVEVPLPDISEQSQVAETLESFDESIQAENQRIRRLQRLKSGLMQDLLSGEVRITDADIEIPDEVLAHG